MNEKTQNGAGLPTPWALVPSIVFAYVNSDVEKDFERAHDLCRQYGLDYQETRSEILARAVRRSAQLDAARPEAPKKAGKQ